MAAMAEIICKQNVIVSGIQEANGASNQIHMQASEFV